MVNITHKQLVEEALKRSSVKKVYDELEDEFILLEQMIAARKKAQKTQAQIAAAMNTSTSVVGRLETGGGKKHHSPSLSTLRKYADVLGYRLSIRFLPKSVA